MSQPSELSLEKMDSIDWDRITEQQAASLGLALGAFNDATEARDRTQAVFLARASSLVVSVVVGTVLLTWSSPVTAVAGIAGALGMSAAVSWWQLYRANLWVRRASAMMKADVAKLPHE